MAKINLDISNLKDSDIYSLILFSLFKLHDIPEYAALSELVYILDKDSLLKLCEYYGGMTLKIPTIEELELVIYALVLYQYVDIEHISYESAVNNLKDKVKNINELKQTYHSLKDILSNYDFKSR